MFRRFLALALALGLAALVGVTVKFPHIAVGETAQPLNVTIQPKKPTLVCAGPVFVNGGQNGVTIGSFTSSGSVNVVGQNSGTLIAQVSSGEKVLTGTETGSKNFNAVQSQATNQKLAFGLSASNCVPGTSSAWLVAGDNSVGREALLVLANPSAVDATVSLQLYGVSGPIQGAGLSGISAPAGQVTVLPLAAFAPKTETFSVFVESRGAQLGIWLQQKTIRGLTPGGLDLVGVSAEPKKQVSIPGVFLRDVASLNQMATADTDFADTKPLLRITAPGDQDASFTAQVQGADGSSFGNVIQGAVPAGTTRDFALEDLTNGNYSVTVSADEPIVAGVRFSRLSSGKPDFAWAQSVAPTKLNGGFTTVNAGNTKLSVMNVSNVAATVTIDSKAYTVAANNNIAISLAPGKRYTIGSSSGVAVSQVVDISGGIATVPVLDYQSVGGKLLVRLR